MFGAQKKPINTTSKVGESSNPKSSGYDMARLQVKRQQDNNAHQVHPNQANPQNMIRNNHGKLKGETPLSVPGFDPVGPEDDIVTFFKHRIPAESKKSTFSIVLNTLAVVFLLLVAFTLAFNLNTEFRSLSSQFFSTRFGVNLANVIPKFLQTDMGDELGEGLSSVTDLDTKSLEATNTLEQSISLVRRGSWAHIDKKIAGTCLTWAPSQQCLVKGYYLASRGLKASAKMMFKVPETSLKSMSNLEQATWFHTLSLIKENTAASSREFNKTHQLLGSKSPTTKAVFFDDIIRLHIAKGNVSDALYFYGLAKKQLDQKSLNYFQSKWGVLIIIVSKKPVTAPIVERAVTSGRTAFKNDPMGLELLAKASIKSGHFERIRPLISNAVAENEAQGIDKELRRKLWQLRIRADLGSANRAEASKGLEFYRSAFGIDTFYQMMSLGLAISPLGQFPSERIGRIWGGASRKNLPWEVRYLLTLADIRSNKLATSLADIQSLEASLRSSSKFDQAWIHLLRAEHLHATRRFAESKAIAQRLSKEKQASLFGYDLLIRNAQALRQVQEVGKLRLEIDRIRNSSVFGRSIEYLRSPFGPMSLLN